MQLVLQASKAFKVQQAHQVHKVVLAVQVLQASKEHRDQQVHQA